MFVIAVRVWTSLMFDIAVVATVIASLTFNVAVVDSDKGQAKNIEPQASQQSLQHMCNGTAHQPIHFHPIQHSNKQQNQHTTQQLTGICLNYVNFAWSEF